MKIMVRSNIMAKSFIIYGGGGEGGGGDGGRVWEGGQNYVQVIREEVTVMKTTIIEIKSLMVELSSYHFIYFHPDGKMKSYWNEKISF